MLTAVSMVVLLGFAAFAVDIGKRNQMLAGAQHAIDTAVLAGAQFLSTHDADYAGAAARIKVVVKQNLGIAVSDWAMCSDADHLVTTVPSDSTCISFRRIASVGSKPTRYDIRVRLPRYKMDTIFGSVLGVDVIDIAATAASNGNNCPIGSTCGSGVTTTVHVMTPEEAACNARTTLDLMLDDALWATCGRWFPSEDRSVWRATYCATDYVTFTRNGIPESWLFSPISRHLWYYDSICAPYISLAERDGWVRDACFASDLALVYTDSTLWSLCRELRPSLESMSSYLATTTIPAPTTTSRSTPRSTTPTTVAPGVSVPTSLELSS